ncbi:hypothetical protein ACLOJK_003727 [Asimina triloba]
MDIFLLVLAAVVFFIFSSISNHVFGKKTLKNLPPTPPSLPIIGHLRFLQQPLHRSLAALSRCYSPILYLRFGSRPVLLVSSPSMAEDCLSRNDIIFANRPQILAGKHLGYNYTAIGFAPYGPHWRNLRRIATIEILSSYRLQMLSSFRAKEVRYLAKALFKECGMGKSVVELKSRLSELSFNVMMGMIANKRYYGDEVVDLEEAKRFRRFVKQGAVLAGASNYGDFVPVLRWIAYRGVERRMIELARERDEFLQGLIDEQLKKMKEKEKVDEDQETRTNKKKTLIEVLLSLQETEPEYYSNYIIKGLLAIVTAGIRLELIVFDCEIGYDQALLTAGTDTSALTIEWAMALLVNHPHVLKKAKAEMHEQVGGDHLLEESDLPKLPYLHCIINETLRLYPVAPLLLPHHSSEETTVGGFAVPQGTTLLINAWAIHRDPEVWFEPDEFKPERFEGELEMGKEGCEFMPFGRGRRACPGEGLARRVVSLAVGTLVQCFEWERVGEEKVDMSEGPGLTMPKAQPLEAVCKPREAMMPILSQL